MFKIKGQKKNETKEITAESEIKKETYSFKKTKDILYTMEGETKNIGKIVLFITDQNIKQQLNNIIIKQILQIGILDY